MFDVLNSTNFLLINSKTRYMKKTFGLIVLLLVSLWSIAQVKKTNTPIERKAYTYYYPAPNANSIKKKPIGQGGSFRPFDWAENQNQYIGRVIVINATYSGRNDNKYQINMKERQDGGYKKYYDPTVGRYITDYTRYEDEKTYCWKSFEEINTYKKIVVNIPEYYWKNGGQLLPERLGMGVYKLFLEVTDVEPVSICNNGMVSSSETKDSKSVYYVLSKIQRYDY